MGWYRRYLFRKLASLALMSSFWRKGIVLPDQWEKQDGRFDVEEKVFQYHSWYGYASESRASILVSVPLS
jgi:hypothetical protein